MTPWDYLTSSSWVDYTRKAIYAAWTAFSGVERVLAWVHCAGDALDAKTGAGVAERSIARAEGLAELALRGAPPAP